MNRRTFCLLPLALLIPRGAPAGSVGVAAIDRLRILKAADRFLKQQPITVTAAHSPRSAGGVHDYFSEGDYWWPDPKNADGPYIQRDGLTNPNNFTAHRQALMRLSVQVPALAAAWLITKDSRYATHAARHLKAWFLDDSTRMNPNLQYAQAIHGKATGRGIGIIDTIHLVEVVRAATRLEKSNALAIAERDRLRQWFADYLRWMTTHPYGIDEREANNNHGTCWVMQAAEFARFTDSKDIIVLCRDRYKTALVPTQIATDGSLPLELKRTKPYSYSLFNLEAMAAVCQILSTPGDNLWTFQLSDGRGMGKALEFMYPYIADKSKWPYPADVMFFDQWPVRQSSLLFGGVALERPQYVTTWRKLNPDPMVEETIRNYPIRQPVLWMEAG
jgi:hypothetical protein